MSEAASKRYKNSIVKKGKIKEWGIHSKKGRIYLPILNRGWQTFAAQLEVVVILVVREFYANAYEHESILSASIY